MQRNCNPRLCCCWDKPHHFCRKESGSKFLQSSLLATGLGYSVTTNGFVVVFLFCVF